MAIPFDNKDCTGWVLFEPKYIKGENVNNYHVAEAMVWRDEPRHDTGSKLRFNLSTNPSHKTICGEELKEEIRGIPFDSEDALRTHLASLQNEGAHEICGCCAGHFFKDDPNDQ